MCLEAAERPQWPRLYSSGRPRSYDHIPSLIGDRGPVLRILGWALIYHWYYAAVEKKLKSGCVWNRAVRCLARWGANSNACFHSWMSPSGRQAVNFFKCACILVQSKLSIPRVVTNMRLAWYWEWLSTKAGTDWFEIHWWLGCYLQWVCRCVHWVAIWGSWIY